MIDRKREREREKDRITKKEKKISTSFLFCSLLTLLFSFFFFSSETNPPTQKKKKKKKSQVARLARSAATTFAPRASGATGKNPAHKGSTLYAIFGAQAWLSVVAGGLLSFNVLFPSDEPSIARLIGMWSVWMFTVPALRARECGPAEKEALNLLFLLIPLANVTIPIFAKSFPLVFSADVLLLFGVLAWKGAAPWQEEAKEEA